MINITDVGRKGAEQVGELKILKKPDTNGVDGFVDGLRSLKTTKLEVRTADGVLMPVEVTPIPVAGRGISLLGKLSLLQQTGYMHDSSGVRHGMLSPNYDYTGRNRKDSIRFMPTNDGFTIKNGVWLPDAQHTLMLAGATSLESEGVGSDHHAIDPEHKAGVYGATSLGDMSKAINHAQHGVRKSGMSIAEGLTNGVLGNVFARGSIDGFDGFDVSNDYTGSEGAVFYIPKSYLESPDQTMGAYFGPDIDGVTPDRVFAGAALQANMMRGKNPNEYMKAMEVSECHN